MKLRADGATASAMEYYSELCLPPDQMLAGYEDVEQYVAWRETGAGGAEYAPRSALLADGGHRFSVSAITFDKYEELVWMGNQGGHVTSYYGPDLQKYTSFQVHESEEVRHIATLEHGLLALTNTTLRHQIRRGIPRHTHRSENMRDMQCLLQLGGQRVLMGGHQDQLLDLDLNTMQETIIAEDSARCAVMRCSGGALVACGGASGAVVLRDVRCPGRAVHRLRAHTVCLSDLDMQGDLLVTAGFTDGAGGEAEAEQYVLVWDVRRLRGGGSGAGEGCARSVPLPAAPLLLHFVPAVSGRAAAVSADGHTVLFNVNRHDDDHTHYSQFQVDTQSSLCTVLDISATSQALAFGDAAGHVHLYCPHHNTHPTFNNFSRQTEFAVPPEHLPSARMTDETFHPSTVPLPPLTSGDRYLSHWPAELIKPAYRKPKPIDPKVLSSMKMQGPIGYAPNPRTCRRNQMPYVEEATPGGARAGGAVRPSDASAGAQPIPKRYLKVEVRYNKPVAGAETGAGGVEAEDFNRTGFPGLEATLPNSYCNPMLQVLYYLGPVKATLLAHSCVKEFCLSCELGFLFRMLDTCSGAPCQASNFLRAFRTVPEAAALGLILPDRSPALSAHIDLVALLQSWIRFMLHQVHLELLETRKQDKELAARAALASRAAITVSAVSARLASARVEEATCAEVVVAEAGAGAEAGAELAEEALHVMTLCEESGGWLECEEAAAAAVEEREASDISELFGITQAQINTCLKCDKEEERESVVLACALQYPAAGQSAGEDGGFVPLLRAALAWRRTTPAWCDTCERFSPTSQRARLVRLPPILTINFGGVGAHEKAYWKKGLAKESSEGGRSARGGVGAGAGGSKPCRYGVHCARPGCRFRHPDSGSGESSAWPVPGDEANSTGAAETHCLIPLHLQITVQPDGEILFSDREAETAKTETVRERGESDARASYDLNACVASVERSRNAVAYIRIRGQWYLFNDVSITRVSSEEVVQFGAWWKSPCVLFYTSTTLAARGVCAGAEAVAGAGVAPVFAEETRPVSRNFTPLAPHEMPTPGTLVGMDAEFVTLNSEQVEVRSDGQRSTLRPSHMSVARITCVRGEGPLEGVPFIDDYISTQEQVVDYLTKFSGIKPGDLDANFSSKHLTTLKSTYRKLRSLVDCGVVFVGHGLNNDFRVINLVVPPEQVVDTVQLFHLPHHRMVSLKFLAWHFLKVHIQSETHDSVEDARTALRLRRKWAELGAAGELRAALQELYRAGDAASWRVDDPLLSPPLHHV